MDDRLYQVEQQKQQSLNSGNSMYEDLLKENQALYDKQIANSLEQERIQNEIADKQLANQTRKIEQQKETARNNYDTESKRAKNDYLGFTNPYGVQAESLASQGLGNSGVSETSKLGGYNTYQNRLASANKVMQDAFVQYDNDLNDAILNNDVQKAQNALNKLNMQMEYAKNYFGNKSSFMQNQFSTSQEIDNNYFNRYQTVYGNIQQEKAQAEAIRQWEAEMAYKKEQDRIAQQQWQKEYALSRARLANEKANSSYPIVDENGNNKDDTSVVEIVCPAFRNSASQEWYKSNFEKEMSESNLVSTVALGIKLGKITQEEANMIYDCYRVNQ